ncbi:MAG: LptF/LptG family permease [Proteobacteria bacterium]|nr:LptF/LptG family permease [Pseudomonadota bacterium]
MFKTIDRYLSKRFLISFLIVTIALIGIFFLFDLLELLRRSVGRSYVHTSSLIKLTLLRMPKFFIVIFPFICMMSTLISLSKLNHNQEIIAIRGCGMSAFRLVLSYVVCILGLSILTLGVMNPLSSITQKMAVKTENAIFSNSLENENLFFDTSGLWLKESIMIDEKKVDRIIRLGPFIKETKEFSNVDIVENIDDHFKNRYMAEKVSLNNDAWNLKNIRIWTRDEEEKSEACYALKTNYNIEKIQQNNIHPEMISFWQLPQFINLLEQSGLSSVRYKLHFYNQLAKIVQSFALILLACAFCLKPTRYHRTTVLLFYGIILAFFLHFLTDVVHALGMSYRIPLVLSAFAPSLITIFLSFGLLFKSEHG